LSERDSHEFTNVKPLLFVFGGERDLVLSLDTRDRKKRPRFHFAPGNTAVRHSLYGFVHGDNQYGMLVLPADRIVELWSALDFRQVRELMGLRQIRLGSELELASLFPACAVSAVPPFGSLFDMPILLDRALATKEVMQFAIGTPRDVIYMSTTDFMTLVQPVVGSFSGRVNPSRAIHAETMDAAWKSHAAA
jgi:prolyl-tRNA editing enzyme YbaK/EbsC (Cys-tRNA(Pro) deacylase)